MLQYKDILDMSDGFFLLLVVVAGNFIAETLGCQVQHLLSKNMFAKQLVIFFMIYFTINFSSTRNPSPLLTLIKAGILWIFFLLFTKMSIGFTGIVLLILVLIYTFNNYRKYLNAKKDKSKDEYIKTIQKTLIALVVILTILGTSKYYIAKKREFRGNFKFYKFIFGVPSCKSLR